MSETNSILIGNFIEKAYFDFGYHVNTKRHLPLVNDGLKPVYRRILYSAYTFPDKFIKTAQLAGDVMGKYHPHGDKSITDAISKMVNYGLLDGQGGHGTKFLNGTVIGPAAPRYSEVKLNSRYRKLIELLIHYVPFENSEIPGFTMPTYLPTPYPIILTYGSLGIGIGINTRLPAFTIESMHEAVLGDTHELLRAPQGLLIDHSESDLEALWNEGRGWIAYTMPTSRHNEPDGEGILIEGSTLIHQPDLGEIQWWIDNGYVFQRDITSGKQKKLFFGINKYVRKIDLELLEDLVKRAVRVRKYYNLNVSTGEQIYRITLRNWLKESVSNYVELINSYKKDQIDKCNYQITVFSWLPKVVEEINRLNSTYSTEELRSMDIKEVIMENIGIEYDILTSVLRKSLNSLIKTDADREIEELKVKIKEIDSLNAAQYIHEVITTLK